MKIVHLLPALEQGGVESVVCDLARLLVREGHEVLVVSAGGRLVARIEQAGARHRTLDLKSKNPLTYFPRANRLRRILRDEKPDLVCTHSRVPAWLFVWANRALGLKWITYAHGANSVSRYSAVMTRGDLVVTPSRFLADYLKQHYGTRSGRSGSSPTPWTRRGSTRTTSTGRSSPRCGARGASARATKSGWRSAASRR